MTSWLRRGAAAIGLAGERSDLWLAGALASLAYLGWIPILLAVGPPRPDDLQYLAVRVVTSGAYPVNVIALAVAMVSGFLLLCLLSAMAEVALTVRAGPPHPTGRSSSRATFSALAVVLLASLPALAAAAVLAVGVAAHAPTEFSSPDRGSSVYLRMATVLLPQLLLLGAALVVSQAFGGLALRLTLEAPDQLGAALRRAVGELGRRPWRWAGVALAGVIKDLGLLVLSFVLLRVLWARIGDGLGPGLLSRPEIPLLLVGFVAIWLTLLLIGGALHAAISAWWLLERSVPGAGDGVATQEGGPR